MSNRLVGVGRTAAALAVGLGGMTMTALAPLAATAGEADEPAASYVSVSAADDFFHAEIIRIPVGTEVYWTNDGRNPHTITADDGSFDSGDLPPGATFEWTFTEPGIYPYYCLYHGAPGGIGMAGLIVVGDAPLPGGGGTDVGPGREPVPTQPGATLRVPQDHATVQAAVDAAQPGDLVLIGPGIYHEAVRVLTPYLTLRGTDRNAVILDGEYHLPNGIRVMEADGVAVENLTVRHYRLNGVYWTGVHGYRASYMTTYANGDYGLYAFDSVWGRFEHSYAAGHPDSGFYIGQCQPCHAVITDVEAVANGVGYSGTNAGGDLWIVNSEWHDNMAGIVPNTLDSERLAPQAGATIAGNHVHHNNNTEAPAKPLPTVALGIGIVVSGGVDNTVTGNRVTDHAAYGIAVFPIIDANMWLPAGNRVSGNHVARSGLADLALGWLSQGGDCFADNAHATTLPPAAEVQFACQTDAARPRPGGGSMAVTNRLLGLFGVALAGHAPGGDWKAYPDSPAQPGMPEPDAPPVLAVPEAAVPGPVDVRPLAAIPANDDAPTITPEVTLMGIPLTTSPAALLIGLYGYVLPLVLYTAWVVIGAWDLVRREDLGTRARAVWLAVILVVPVVGPLAYLFAGRSPIPLGLRLVLTVGGLAVYAVLVAVGFALA